jgi:CsoR family transcriptional regulator, copper-sensing transcriptional repressor
MVVRGYTMERSEYLTRLRKIEGQVRGLQRMIENDDYCIDVITQIGSATSALKSVAVGLLDQHVRTCVVTAAKSSDEERDDKLIEASRAIERLLKI